MLKKNYVILVGILWMIKDFRFLYLSDILKEKEKWMNFEVCNVVELLGKRTVNITVSITRNASSWMGW